MADDKTPPLVLGEENGTDPFKANNSLNRSPRKDASQEIGTLREDLKALADQFAKFLELSEQQSKDLTELRNKQAEITYNSSREIQHPRIPHSSTSVNVDDADAILGERVQTSGIANSIVNTQHTTEGQSGNLTHSNVNANTAGAYPQPHTHTRTYCHPGAHDIRVPFTKWNPELWFRNLEVQFEFRKTSTDVEKYWTVINNMGDDVRVLGDSVLSSEEGYNYEDLKALVLRKFAKTPQQKLHELASDLRMEGRTPSDFFRHMDNLAQGTVKKDTLYTWWMNKIPCNVQAMLPTVYCAERLPTILTEADRLFELYKRQETGSISEVATDAGKNSLTTVLEAIQKGFNEMKGRGKTRSRSKSRTRGEASSSGLCYYHEKFKEKAFKCKGKCAMRGTMAKKPPHSDSGKKDKNAPSEDSKN